MKVSNHNIRFIFRVVTMMMLGLGLSLGVRVMLENSQLDLLLPRSDMRDLLLFVAPGVSLMLIQYTLAVKSFGVRSLLIEFLAFLGAYCIFLSLTFSYYFGIDVQVSSRECFLWIFSCSDAVVIRTMDQPKALIFALAGATICGLAILIDLRKVKPL